MAYYIVSDENLTGIANKIRSKGGTSEQLEFPAGYESAIDAIPTGEAPTGTKTVNVSENGTTVEDVANYANAQIITNVPNSYGAGDEGKVVSGGTLVAQTPDTCTENGTVDTTLINSLTVNVSGGGSPDDPDDFTGGNILAITGHGTEYIITDFCGPLEGIFSTKFSDSNVTAYEHYWSMALNNNRVGLQRSGNSAQCSLGTTGGFLLSLPNFSGGGIVTQKFDTYGIGTGTANKPLAIGRGYYNGNLESQIATFNFYGLNVLTKDFQYIARFFPWIENGVACIKELISGTIYTNSGTGAFDYIDLEGVVHIA